MNKGTQDNHPALAVKKACLARSGVYFYTYDEMLARGYTPDKKKTVYSEYRPADVLSRCKDKFAFAVVTKEHTREQTNAENFRKQAAGIVGDDITLEKMPNGETGIYGKLAFYTSDAYDYYKAGNKETSADYKSVVVPDISGQYDFILKDILSVNGVVVTARGRGGPSVRVQDALAPDGNNICGGSTMSGKKGVLSFLGIGRVKDDSFSLSKVVLDGAKTLHSLDAAGKEALVGTIMSHITDLADGDNKELLIGAVKDSLNHPIEAIAKTKEVSQVIDGLYAACVAEEKQAAETALKGIVGTKDAKDKDDKKDKDDGEDDEKEKDDEKTDKKTMDSMIDDIVEKTSKRVLDGIDALIEKQVKKSLGIQEQSKKVKQSTQDSVDDTIREEGAFLLDGTFNG